MSRQVLKHRSGRVIALGRALLAAVFLFAIWVDPTQPVQSAGQTYALLAAYVAIAVAIAIAVWNDWWLDAKLAAPAHALDIVAFTFLVFATNGYTSPFFVFFVFIILSAAIRWGWRETSLTAAAVVLLFLGAGFLVALHTSAAEIADFDLQRFIIRSGHLVILSAILIWFGVNQGFSGIELPDDGFLRDPSLDDPPLESALAATMALTGAATAVFLWRVRGSRDVTLLQRRNDRSDSRKFRQNGQNEIGDRAFLFRLKGDRALTRTPQRRMLFFAADLWMDRDIAAGAGIAEGLAIPVRTATGEGQLLLGAIAGLCTDHIEFGDRIAESISAHLQRHAFILAAHETAAAGARLSLSRDLHDSIVQFLAGATFKIEAISRSTKSGRPVESDLAELKRLLLEEQRELRSAIGALRNNLVALPTLASDLRGLCERLARQWDIDCAFRAEVPQLEAPMRLHLDTHQLIRETVANAVRHAAAKRVEVELDCDADTLLLEITNDGELGERMEADSPWSLRERVDEANGSLMLTSRDGRTTVSVRLPLKEQGEL
jgi:signal transduction histidine kinase